MRSPCFWASACITQTAEGKRVRPLRKFTSPFKNTISKNYTERIKVDRTCHSSIPQMNIFFLSLIIQIHILNQNHTQALVSSSLLWPLLTGPDPAASSTLVATSTSCFQASRLSSHTRHHSHEGKKRLAHVPASICVFSHTRTTRYCIYREKHVISYFTLCQKVVNRSIHVSCLCLTVLVMN